MFNKLFGFNKTNNTKSKCIEMANKFSEISIFGRMAFACCALELYLEDHHLNTLPWTKIVNKFWAFSSSEYIDNWHDELVEYLPDCILEFKEYDSPSKWEYITESTFKELYELYSNIPNSNETNLIMGSIVEICGVELYGKIQPPAKQSLNELFDLIFFLKSKSYRIPDISQFAKFSINENHGWGSNIYRSDFTSKA